MLQNMQDYADNRLTKLDQLLEVDGGVAHWLGYDSKHGWLLLDRSLGCNKPGTQGDVTLRFTRLSDLRFVAVPKNKWHGGSIKRVDWISTPDDEKKHLALLLKEWLRRHHGWVMPRRWREIPRLLSQHTTAATAVPPALTEKDLRLCCMWANLCSGIASSYDHSLSMLVENIGLHHASRLISARLAERCAAHFYNALGDVVRDTSIEQLKDGSHGEWQDFDLDVGYPVDVKNSRSTYRGRLHYSEHAVARFKQERIGGEDVRVAGVRSPYFANPEQVANNEHNDGATVLGEVSASEIERLVRWGDAKFGHLFSIRLWTPKKIPGWLFEYPDRYYSGRAHAVELMKTMILEGQPEYLLPGQWLVAKALGQDLAAHFGSDPMLAELCDLIETCGLAKRCLIVYAMGATLRAVMAEEDAAPVLAQLRDAANIGQSQLKTWNPWGLDDPLDYVDRFLSAFTEMADGIKQFAAGIRIFHLTGPDTLVAEMNDGSRWTMLAYCGGWIDSIGRCGSSPLVVGRQKHCSKCRHLICSDCFFCSENCSSNLESRNELAKNMGRPPWDAYTDSSVNLEDLGHESRTLRREPGHEGADWDADFEDGAPGT